jgi:hypothetical protein
MVVALPDAAIAIVDTQFGFLVAADLPPAVDGLALRVEMSGGAFGTATLDVPIAFKVRNYMM